LAQAAGLSLGKLVDVSEGGNNYPTPIYGAAKGMGDVALENSVAPDIQTGQMEIDLTVTLTYKLN
jgi:uncharacterized protein YggE